MACTGGYISEKALAVVVTPTISIVGPFLPLRCTRFPIGFDPRYSFAKASFTIATRVEVSRRRQSDRPSIRGTPIVWR